MGNPSKIVRWTAIIVSAAYTAALYVTGLKLDTIAKKGLALLPTVLALAVVAFDIWIWKLKTVMRLHRRPRLDGLWRATIQPDGRGAGPGGGNPGPVLGYAIIEQRFWSISVTQLTSESASYSRASTFIRRPESERTTLSFTYDNTPRRAHTSHSARHSGACELSVPKGAPGFVTGSYFTDRFTAGDITLELLDRTTNYEDFGAVEAHIRT